MKPACYFSEYNFVKSRAIGMKANIPGGGNVLATSDLDYQSIVGIAGGKDRFEQCLIKVLALVKHFFQNEFVT